MDPPTSTPRPPLRSRAAFSPTTLLPPPPPPATRPRAPPPSCSPLACEWRHRCSVCELGVTAGQSCVCRASRSGKNFEMRAARAAGGGGATTSEITSAGSIVPTPCLRTNTPRNHSTRAFQLQSQAKRRLHILPPVERRRQQQEPEQEPSGFRIPPSRRAAAAGRGGRDVAESQNPDTYTRLRLTTEATAKKQAEIGVEICDLSNHAGACASAAGFGNSGRRQTSARMGRRSRASLPRLLLLKPSKQASIFDLL